MLKLTNIQTIKIDNYIKAEMKREKIPGLAIGIFSKGKILFARGYGLANLDENTKVTVDTLFCLCSISKQFVSTAIMMLVEEGKLGIEDSITKYFRDSPDAWKPIKIKNLLSHTSGFHDYDNTKYCLPGGLFDDSINFGEDQLAERSYKLPVNFKPGERYAYCNTNYLLLGIIIHKITRKFWFDYLKLRIFVPLHMDSMRLIKQDDMVLNEATGYQFKRNKFHEGVSFSDTFSSIADGSLYCNVLDFGKWDNALYQNSLLNRTSLDVLWSVFKINDGKINKGNYGFGWEINKANGHKVIEHTGGSDSGFCGNFSRYIDDELAIVVLCNREFEAGQPAEVITHKVAGFVKSELMPPKSKSLRWQKHTLGHYEEDYLK